MSVAPGLTAIGFTGGTLDRADALRHDPAALAAKLDWRARLLRLDGLMPAADDDGRLVWDSLAALPEDAEVILLGLDEAGRAHVAALLPQSGEGTVPAMRSPALMGLLASLQPARRRPMPRRAA